MASKRAAAGGGAPESWLWVRDTETDIIANQAYVEARVVTSNADGSKVVELLNGTSATVKPDMQYEPILSRAELALDFPDMVQMGDVNEATILRAIKNRFAKELIYTNIGTILVAMNPFKRIDCYGPAYVQEHLNSVPGEPSDPHVFQVASAAYRGVRSEQRDQSIIISGESGAGKTEATKHCLKFFAEAAGSSEGNMEDKLISANPVLEAFGNAKTVRNNNSSRFGKFMEVHFDGRFAICGCKIINYLLEKSRIVFQTNLERNYHIFYQLPTASSDTLLAQLNLTRRPEDYGYTKHSQLQVPGLNDHEEFKDVMDSFKTLDFKEEDYLPMFKIVAGLLHLSNVEFEEVDSDTCRLSTSAACNKGRVDAAAQLGMDAELLGQGLTKKLIVVRGERTLSPLSLFNARSARDSMAKALYNKMFNWLIGRVNDSMKSGLSKSQNIIGVLDIFGFEIFVSNSFEQLCINFCNEKLQQHFNTYVFKMEIKCYEAEAITFDEVKFVDNQDVLDMVEAKPLGLLVMLDDECRVPKGSDKGYLEKIRKAHDKNHRFLATYKGAKDVEFGVNHYAGRVMYNVDTFLEKNKDELLLNIVELCTGSSEAFIRHLFADEATGAKTEKITQGLGFRNSLDDLMKTLNRTDPQYIRCVKSNSPKKPLLFEAGICLSQLRFAGVFEAVRVRQLGFPFRYKHAVFFMRYRCCAQDIKRFLAKLPQGGGTSFPFKQQCTELLLDIIKGNTTQEPALHPVDKKFKLGLTMVLYRADQHRRLEGLRDTKRWFSAEEIQRVFKGFRGRKIARVLRVLREEMRAAIKARSFSAVKAALASAKGLPAIQELKVLVVLEGQLSKEEGLLATIAKLLVQEPEDHFDAYRKALEEGKTLSASAALVTPGLSPSLLPTANPQYISLETRFSSVEKRKEVKRALDAALARGSADEIQKALASADGTLGAGNVPKDVLERAQEQIRKMAEEEATLNTLTAALDVGKAVAKGGVGTLDVSGLNVTRLEEVAAGVAAGRLVGSTPRYKSLITSITAVTSLRKALARAAAAAAAAQPTNPAANPASTFAPWEAVEREVVASREAAERGDLVKEAEDEFALVSREVGDKKVCAAVLSALASGAAEGVCGSMDLASAQVTALSEALEAASVVAGAGGVSTVTKAAMEAGEGIKRLRAAQVAGDWKAIRSISEEGLNPPSPRTPTPLTVGEYTRAKDECDNHKMVKELLEALAKGGATLPSGQWILDATAIDTKTLGERIEGAVKVGPKTLQAKKLLALAKRIKTLRGMLIAAQAPSLPSPTAFAQTILDEVAATKAEMGAPGEGVPPGTAEELEGARSYGENLILVSALTEALKVGGATGVPGALNFPSPSTPHFDKLGQALALANRLKCRSPEALKLKEACAALKVLRDVARNSEWESFQEALDKLSFFHDSKYPRRAGGEEPGRQSDKAVLASLTRAREKQRTSQAATTAAPAASEGGEEGGTGGGGGEGGEPHAPPSDASAPHSGEHPPPGGLLSKFKAAALKAGKASHTEGGEEREAEEKFKLPVETLAEVELIQAELNNHLSCKDFTECLSKGAPSGDLGVLSAEGVEVDRLAIALKRHARRTGVKTPIACSLAYTSAVVRDLRASLKENDWVGVEATLRSVALNNARVARHLGKSFPAVGFDASKPGPHMSPGGDGGFPSSPRARSYSTAPPASSLDGSSTAGSPLSPRAGGGDAFSSSMLSTTGDSYLPTSILSVVDISPHARIPDLATACDYAGITLCLPGLAEVVRVECEAQYKRVIRDMRSALGKGGATGVVGALDVEGVVDTHALANAIDAARTLGARRPLSMLTERMCRLVWQMRTAVVAGDWAGVEALLNAGTTVLRECVAVGEEDGMGAGDAAPPTPTSLAAGQQQVGKGGLPLALFSELTLYQEEATDRRLQASLRASLSAGGPTGTVGRLILSSVDVTGLEESLELVITLGLGWSSEGGSASLPPTQRTRVVSSSVRSLAATALQVRAARICLIGGGYERLGVLLDYVHTARESDTAYTLKRARSALTPSAGGEGDAVGGGPAPPTRVMNTEDGIGEQAGWGAKLEAGYFDMAKDGVASESLQELAMMQMELSNRVTTEALTHVLGSDCPVGEVGHLVLRPGCTEELERVLDDSLRLGIVTPEAELLVSTGQIIRRLRLAMGGGTTQPNWEAMEDIVGGLKANNIPCAEAGSGELAAYRWELENRVIVGELTTGLGKGCITGRVGRRFIGAIDVIPLSASISKAQSLGARSPEAIHLLFTSRVIVRLRQCLLADNIAEAAVTLDAVSGKSVAVCALGELNAVKEEVDNWRVLTTLAGAVGVGGPGGCAGALDTTGLDTMALERALKEADELGVTTPEAQTLYATASLLLRLRCALLMDAWGGSTAALMAELATAAAGGVGGVGAAHAVAEALHAAAADGGDTVEGLLMEARALTLSDLATPELSLLRAEAANRHTVLAASLALSRGGASGAPGSIDLTRVDLAELDALLAESTSSGVFSEEAGRLVAAGRLVRRLRSTLLSGNWAWVRSVLVEARGVKGGLPAVTLKELQCVQDEVDNREVLSAFNTALGVGGPSGLPGNPDLSSLDTRSLDGAIDSAKSIGIKSQEASIALATGTLVRALRSALKVGDYAAARMALESSQGKPITPTALTELKWYATAVDNWTVITELKLAAGTGYPQGPLLSPDASSILTGPLDDAIGRTMKLGCHSREARTALVSAIAVRRLREATLKGDAAFADLVLGEIEGERDTLVEIKGEVERAHVEFKLRVAIKVLEDGCERRHEATLNAGLTAVRALGISASASTAFTPSGGEVGGSVSQYLASTTPNAPAYPPPVGRHAARIAEAASLLESIGNVRFQLQAGLSSRDPRELIAALAHAGSLSLDDATYPFIPSAKALLAAIQSLEESGRAALASGDAIAMAAVLAAGEGRRGKLDAGSPFNGNPYTRFPMPEIRTLLALPRAEFLRRELDTVLSALTAGKVGSVTGPLEVGGVGAVAPLPNSALPRLEYTNSSSSANPPTTTIITNPGAPYAKRSPNNCELRVVNCTVAVKDLIFGDAPPTDDVIASALANSGTVASTTWVGGSESGGGVGGRGGGSSAAPSGTAAAAAAAATRLNAILAANPNAASAIAQLRAQRHTDDNVSGAAFRVTITTLVNSPRPLFPASGLPTSHFIPGGFGGPSSSYASNSTPASASASASASSTTLFSLAAPSSSTGLGVSTPPTSSPLLRHYSLESYRALKPPHLYSTRFGPGVSTAESRMLLWQPEPISTSLTLLPDGDARASAVKTFRCIAAFMGDTPSNRPLQAGAEVLSIGFSTPVLRDELYVQMMKQLNNNPSAASCERGWVLLYAALSTFPPSEEFENILELWLRVKGATPCVWALHLTLYRGGPGKDTSVGAGAGGESSPNGFPSPNELLALLERAHAPILPTLSQLGPSQDQGLYSASGSGSSVGEILDAGGLSVSSSQVNPFSPYGGAGSSYSGVDAAVAAAQGRPIPFPVSHQQQQQQQQQNSAPRPTPPNAYTGAEVVGGGGGEYDEHVQQRALLTLLSQMRGGPSATSPPKAAASTNSSSSSSSFSGVRSSAPPSSLYAPPYTTVLGNLPSNSSEVESTRSLVDRQLASVQRHIDAAQLN